MVTELQKLRQQQRQIRELREYFLEQVSVDGKGVKFDCRKIFNGELPAFILMNNYYKRMASFDKVPANETEEEVLRLAADLRKYNELGDDIKATKASYELWILFLDNCEDMVSQKVAIAVCSALLFDWVEPVEAVDPWDETVEPLTPNEITAQMIIDARSILLEPQEFEDLEDFEVEEALIKLMGTVCGKDILALCK